MDQVVIYQSEDGRTTLDVRLEDETVWLSQKQLTELFGKAKGTISEHVKHIFEDGELAEASVVRLFRTTAADGKAYEVAHYNLDMVLALGFRVRSPVAVRFRQWAADKLKEYLVKGFVLDDERLKNPDASVYFEQLLERIRDIRSSEKVFWRKVLDIYATSIDYDPSVEASQQFFAAIQNKMHWAAHGHTAAEVIARRADARQPHMGLTSFGGTEPRRSEVSVAKNFLTAEELDTLNRIVMAYLEFAELQARGRRAMHMRDWVAKLDDFLKLGDHDVLTHAGSVSAEAARLKAEAEYDAYRRQLDRLPAPVERDLTKALEAAVDKLPTPKRREKK